MNSTSIEAYETIKKDGTVGEQALKILTLLKFKGVPMTNKEIQKSMDNSIEISSVSGRINDLKKRGKVAVVGKRPCEVTGVMVSVVQPVNQYSTIMFGNEEKL